MLDITQDGNLPQIELKIKKYLKPPPSHIIEPYQNLCFSPHPRHFLYGEKNMLPHDCHSQRALLAEPMAS